jgi:hypothetical protein
MKQFYTYLWLREDGTPYYVGKGSGTRAYDSHKGHRPPKDKSNITIQHWSDESTAFAYEIYLVDFWGRKDLGAGILRNHSDGGENPPRRTKDSYTAQGIKQKGRKLTEEWKENIRKGKMGVKPTEETRIKLVNSHLGHVSTEETRAKLSAIRKGKKPSIETIAKRSAGLRLAWSEGRMKGATGLKHSEEVKRNMSIAAVAREKRKRDAKSV